MKKLVKMLLGFSAVILFLVGCATQVSQPETCLEVKKLEREMIEEIEQLETRAEGHRISGTLGQEKTICLSCAKNQTQEKYFSYLANKEKERLLELRDHYGSCFK